jgi:uncharacterized protein
MGTFAIVGALAEAIAWLFVAVRKANLWAVMTPLLVGMGIVAIATGEPKLTGSVSTPAAAAAGLITGIGLFLATRIFVWFVRWWRTFRAHAAAIYRRGRSLSVPATVALTMLLATGEELFWRGLVQPRVSATLDSRAVGAVVASGAFVVANLPSANLAIVAGALVGGAVWGALAWWTGGVLASTLSHVAWTALMIARPPVISGSGG